MTPSTSQTWQLDNTHTSIGFTVRHMVVAKVNGRFTRFEGTLALGPDGDLTRAQGQVRIDASSIDTQVEARDNHLRSADFFDVARFPELTFQSKRVEPVGKDRFRVIGDLSLHGVTREVPLDVEFLGRVTDPFGAERLAFSGSTQLSRKEFGLHWNQALETGGVLVSDRVDIQLEVQAVKAKEQGAEKAA